LTDPAENASQGGDLIGEHRNPFGAFSPGVEPFHPVTVPDAVRRCRWIAVDINAVAFSVFLIGPSLDRHFLAPCFDSAYPSLAPDTELIQGNDRSGIVKHARTSTVPCWWSDGTPAREQQARPGWCKQIEPLSPGTSGMAFPVHADRGCGLVMFFGPDIALELPALFDIHARCFALFEAVTRIRRSESARVPLISKRELECLKLTANGYTSDEIARLLKLSVHTANQYLSNTTQKLDAVNRMHAVAKALRMGLID
jgi:DNA-binding CsgD family transcriptional regulator